MSRLRCLLILPLLGLCACSGLFHSTAPPLQLYVLEPPVVPAGLATPPRGAATLLIERPLAASGLDTDRIALLRPGDRLDYYAGSRWSAPLPDVLSDLQMTVFHADATWSAIAADRSGFNADYLLQTTIERFGADYPQDTAPPLIRVQLRCLLIRRSDGALLGGFAVTASQQAQANRMASVVAAFSQAAGRAAVSVAQHSDRLLSSVKAPAVP